MKPEMILGPPGTGKTTTLLSLVGDLLTTYEPQQIAFVSFTRKAAWEARDRAIDKFPHLQKKDFQNFSTIHSMCFKRMGMTRQNVMMREDFKEVARNCNEEIQGYVNVEDGTVSGTKSGDKYLFHYGISRARRMAPGDYWAQLPDSAIEGIDGDRFIRFINTLRDYKQHTGKLDFDDMLNEALNMGALDDVRVAIIDEAQDLSRAQWEVIWTLFGNVEKMVIAGDDDQSIFEWSGSDIDTFMSMDADRRVLGHSYRLSPDVHAYANRVISRCQNRIPKDWAPSDKPGTVERKAKLSALRDLISDTESGSWLVLARNAYLLGEPKEYLSGLGIPMVYRGDSMVRPEHLNAIRTYEKLRKGHPVDAAAVQRLYDVLTAGTHVARGHKHLPPDAPETLTWDDLTGNFGLNKALKIEPWYDVLGIPENRKYYYRSLLRHGYKLGEEARITLSTIHSVKGGEADNVILLNGMARRTAAEFEERQDPEHRVFYVGVTRTRGNLYILDSSAKDSYPFPKSSEPPSWVESLVP